MSFGYVYLLLSVCIPTYVSFATTSSSPGLYLAATLSRENDTINSAHQPEFLSRIQIVISTNRTKQQRVTMHLWLTKHIYRPESAHIKGGWHGRLVLRVSASAAQIPRVALFSILSSLSLAPSTHSPRHPQLSLLSSLTVSVPSPCIKPHGCTDSPTPCNRFHDALRRPR